MMTTFGLTRVQRDVLEFIEAYLREHKGTSPSFEEIQVQFGWGSKSRVSEVLDDLEERGRIVRQSGRARSIALTKTPRAAVLLSPDLYAALARYCHARGERIDDVLADAVSHFLDEMTERPTTDGRAELTEAGRALLGAST